MRLIRDWTLIQRSGVGLALTIMLVAARSEAQSIRGRVTAGNDPVPGALIELMRTSDSMIVGRTSSGGDGEFRVSFSSQDPVLLRARAIGFHPWIGSVRRQEPEGDATLYVELVRAPFELAEVVASGDRGSCGKRTVNQAQMSAIVELVQTTDAIIARNLTRGDLRFESELESVEVITSGRRDSTVTRSTRVISTWPVVAPAPDILQHVGFGREKAGAEGNGRWFYGLDLGVLWSEWFVSQHCFWFEDGHRNNEDSTVSLRFKPRERSDLVDVEGELVIDTSAWTIRRLIFYHVNLPSWFSSHSSGGMLEFASTPEGVWYPSRWQTHAPIEQARQDLSRPVLGAVIQPRPKAPNLVGYVEERGQVVKVSVASGRDR